MTIQMIIAIALIIIGMLFMIASLIGIIRLPDFFARLHAQGIGDTIGAFLILAGMMVWTGANLLSIKILLIFIIIILTNPLGTNLMMIAAINRVDYQGYASKMKGETSDQFGKEDRYDTEPYHEEESEPEPEEEPEHISEPVVVPEKEPKPVSEPVVVPEKEPEPVPEPDTAPEKEPEHASRMKSEPEKEPEPESLKVKESDKAKTNRDKKKHDPRQPERGKKQEKKGKNSEKKKKPRKRKPSMNMNKAELTSIAEGMGLEIPEGSTKRQILDLIYSSKKN